MWYALYDPTTYRFKSFVNERFADTALPNDGSYISFPDADYELLSETLTQEHIYNAHDGSWIWKPSTTVEQGLAQQWAFVRTERSYRLASCDWTQVTDVPLPTEKRQAWATYRQALRDITSQADPFNITWPTPPI